MIKKIFFIFLLFLFFIQRPVILYAMENSNNPKQVYPSIEDLRPHYAAIHQIRLVLDEICEQCCNEQSSEQRLEKSGFIYNPRPNPFYYRTNYNIFVATNTWKDGKETLSYLYTPFGKVVLLCRDSSEISSRFFNAMQEKWEIEEVTEKFEQYHCFIKKTFSQLSQKTISNGQTLPQKIYIIKRIGSIELFSADTQGHTFFAFHETGFMMYNHCLDIFRELSNYQGHF